MASFVAGISCAFVTVVDARLSDKRHVLARSSHANIVGTQQAVVVARSSLRDRGIAKTIVAAGVVGAFVAITVAGATGNRDVSALPVEADIVRTGILVIIAKIGVWIGIMGALKALAYIGCTFVSIVRAGTGNA